MTIPLGIRVDAESASAVTNLNKVATAERQIGNEAVTAGQKMAESFRAASDPARSALQVVNNLREGLFRLTATFGVTAAITQFTRGIVDSSNKMIGWRQSFNAATGSIVSGAAELNYARSEAERLGLSLDSSTYSFAKLTAATRGTILAGEETRNIFSAVSEASRVLNLGTEQTTGALRAIEQMISKGNVQAEELRGQLSERLPGAFRLAADAMEVTTAELGKMLENGEVLASELIPKLADKLHDLYGDAAVDAANSPAAELARLQNAILELQVAIGNAGFMTIIAEGARSFTDAIRSIVESGALEYIIQGLGYIALAATAAFGSKVIGIIGAYIAEMIKAVAVASAVSEQEAMMTATTVANTEAEVANNLVALERIELARVDLASKQAILRTDVMMAQRTLQATQNSAALSGIIAVRREATEALVEAERRLGIVTAESASLARARGIVETELTAATNAHTLAQNQQTAAMSTGAIVMARLKTVVSGLFTLMGGWIGVIALVAYGFYKLWEAATEGERALAAPIEKLQEMNGELQKQLDLQDLVASGRATEGTAKAVQAYDAAKASLAEYQKQLENATIAQKAMADDVALYGDSNLVASAMVDGLTAKIQEANETISKNAFLIMRLGGELPPEIQKMKDGFVEVTESVKEWLGFMREAPAVIAAMGEAEKGFNDDMEKKLDKLRLVRIEQEQGLGAALAFEAAQKKSAETGMTVEQAMLSLDAATLKNIASVVELTAANEAHQDSEREAKSALKDKETALRDMNKALEEQRTAYDDLLTISRDISSDLDGDFAKAENEHSERLNEISSNVQTLIEKKNELNGVGLTWTDIILAEANAITAANRQFEINNRLAQVAETKRKSAGSVVDRAVKNLKDEVTALKMSNTQLAIQEAMLTAVTAAQSDYTEGRRDSAQLTKEEIDNITDRTKGLMAEGKAAEIVNDATEKKKAALQELADMSFSPLLDDIALLDFAIKEAFDPKVVERLKTQIQIETLGSFHALLGAVQTFSKEGSGSFEKIQTAMAALSIVQDVLAMKAAVTAVLTQGQGEPYSAFARMAAMAAAVAPFIASIGGTLASLGGSGSSGPTAAQQIQQSQGTGTVLGDATAVSESILNALEITANATSELVGINRGMLNALRAMQFAINGAAASIVRLEFGEASLNQGAGMNSMLNPLGVNTIGGRIISSIFGGDQDLIDQGVRIQGGSFGNVSRNPNASAYQTIETDGGWFRSDRINDEFESLSQAAIDQIQLILASIGDTVREAAIALGLDAEEVNAAIEAFRIEEIRISTMDLTGEEAQEQLTAAFSAIFDDLAGDIVPFIGQFQRVGEGLGETLVRVATGVQVTQEALSRLGFTLEATGPEQFAQISESLIELVGGIEEFITGMLSFVDKFAPEAYKFELLQNDLTRALADVGLAVPATRDEMWELMQSLDATTESGREQIAALIRLENVSDAYYNQLEENAERIRRATEEYSDVATGIIEEIADINLNDFQREIRGIKTWAADTSAELNRLARAAGRAGASAEDLANVQLLAAIKTAQAIARLRDSALDLVDQLYGRLDEIEDEISTIQDAQDAAHQRELDAIEEVDNAAQQAYDAQIAAQQRIREWLDNLLLTPLGALRPRDQLAEGQQQFQEMLARALAGDTEAMAALPDLATRLLELGQDVYASGDPYIALRDSIMAALAQVAELGLPNLPNNGSGNPREEDDIITPELQALYEERDRLLAEQTAAERLALAQQLTEIIHDLIIATGDPLVDIAESLGLNMRDLITDLGINFENMTSETTAQLAEVAQSMGANLEDLAEQIGVDLGSLVDSQSLLNNALEDTINDLPQDERDLLAPLLADVEAAAALGDTAGVEAGITSMEEAINGMSPMLRDLLAPYFLGVTPVDYTELDALAFIDISTAALAETAIRQEELLNRLVQNIVEQNVAAGLPSYEVGTGYVPRTGLATLHQGEAVLPTNVANFFRQSGWNVPTSSSGTDNSYAIVEELRLFREQQEKSDAQMQARIHALEEATIRSGDKQADATRDLTAKMKRLD